MHKSNQIRGAATNEDVGVVIAAAGQSRRMQGADKVGMTIAGRLVLEYSLQCFDGLPSVSRICLVVKDDATERWRDHARRLNLAKVEAVVAGGARRRDSVLAGLRALGPCRWVVIHDGARPCVTAEIIRRGLAAVADTGAAAAAVPVKDTVKAAGVDRYVTSTVPRESLWLVQTPQVFDYDLLLRAYEANDGDVTDDASLVEKMGHKVKLFMGAYSNIKITTPEDVAIAETYLRTEGR